MNRWKLGLLPVVLAACGSEYDWEKPLPYWPDSDPVPVADTIQEDTILQVTIPIVDVLFVIDNSCSMEGEQAALAASFPGFIGYFVGSGLEWHVGVTSTDLDNPLHQGKLVSAQGSLYLDEYTSNPELVFTEMASLGTEGTGNEKGLGATYLALDGEAGWRNSYNAGFYRDEASITTIIISDESDQTADSLLTKKDFIAWYNALKLQPNERTFSSVVSLATGDRYLDVTNDIGGTIWDINDSDWDKVLDYLGVQASGLKTEFYLSKLPVESTIEVRLETDDGTVRTDDDPEFPAYDYVRERNSIKFVDFVPDPLTKVIITYTLLSSAQDPDAVDTFTGDE